MSRQLKVAFVKWRMMGLFIETKILYRIDDKEIVMHAIIRRNELMTSGYDRTMNVLYSADNEMNPKKVLHFNEVFADPHLENYMKKYDKTVSKLYEFDGGI